MFTKVTVNDPFFPKVTQHRAGESLDTQLGPQKLMSSKLQRVLISLIRAIYQSFINCLRGFPGDASGEEPAWPITGNIRDVV